MLIGVICFTFASGSLSSILQNYDNSNAIVSVNGGTPLSNGNVTGSYPSYYANFDVYFSKKRLKFYLARNAIDKRFFNGKLVNCT